jgi:hypothetical protein
MVTVLFINDGYIYEHFPLPQRIDSRAMHALIMLEQSTSIQDLLGTSLYDYLTDAVEGESLAEGSEENLFKQVQYILCLYSVRSAYNFLRSNAMYNKSEESNANQYTLDALTDSIDSKIEYFKKRIIEFIKADSALKATAEESDNDVFSDEDVYNGSVFYPTNPFREDTEDCE